MVDRSILLKGNGDFTAEQVMTVVKGDDPSLQLLSLGLTTAPGCNMDCIYCYNAGGTLEAGRETPYTMTWKDYDKAIREAAVLGAQSVIIVGVGETLMDENWRPIVQLTREQGMIPLIFTNGSLLDKDTCRFLFQYQASIYLSLESVREETFNLITRTKGLFPRVMEGIDNCLEAGFGSINTHNGYQVSDFGINAMIMKANIDELAEMEAFCQRKNILFTSRLPEKLGTAVTLWDDLISPSPEEAERMRKLSEKYSHGSEIFRTDFGCLFWVVGVLLGADGNARLCYSLNQKIELGNIKEVGIQEMIDKRRKHYPFNNNYFCPIHSEMAAQSE